MRDFDRTVAVGIAQTHEGKVQIQQCRQQIGQIGGDGPRFSPYPHRRHCREGDQIPEDFLEREAVRIRAYWHVSGRRPWGPSLAHLIEKLVGRNKERVFPQ